MAPALCVKEIRMNTRPASVTAAIVILAMMCLAMASVAFIPTGGRQQPSSWLSVSLGILVFGLPLYALVMRQSWGRVYVTILFLLMAAALFYNNAKANSQNVAVAVGYALVISALLAWNVWSLWSQKVTAYFSPPTIPSRDA
jgi:hypothetical protein